jgi:phospholipase C
MNVWELLERGEIKRLARRRAAREQGPLPRPGLPAGQDLLPQVKHVVVLMMENHSYDNYLEAGFPGNGVGLTHYNSKRPHQGRLGELHESSSLCR